MFRQLRTFASLERSSFILDIFLASFHKKYGSNIIKGDLQEKIKF